MSVFCCCCCRIVSLVRQFYFKQSFISSSTTNQHIYIDAMHNSICMRHPKHVIWLRLPNHWQLISNNFVFWTKKNFYFYILGTVYQIEMSDYSTNSLQNYVRCNFRSKIVIQFQLHLENGMWQSKININSCEAAKVAVVATASAMEWMKRMK